MSNASIGDRRHRRVRLATGPTGGLAASFGCFVLTVAFAPRAHGQGEPEPPPPPPPTIPITDPPGSPESKRLDSPTNPDVQATALPSVAGRKVRGYAKAGVWELGGGLSLVTGPRQKQAGLAPSVGYFVMDYVEISLLPQLDYAKISGAPGRTRLVGLVEPSWHVQLSGPLFFFFGAGIGVAHEKNTGTGLALAPRIGVNVLVGGNGVANAGFEYIYAASPKASAQERDTATLGLRAGYTIAW